MKTMTIALTGSCEMQCGAIAGKVGDPVVLSLTFDLQGYERGGPFYRKRLLDWSVRSDGFSFSRSEAKAEGIEDSTDGPWLTWRGPHQTPFFYLTASEHVGQVGRYVNLVFGYRSGNPFDAMVGYHACRNSTCSGMTWDGPKETAVVGTPVPVPLPPALALMLFPLAGLGWVKRRGAMKAA